jgi:hypothetical protein
MSEFYTQNGWKGEKYNGDLSTKDIAKLIRKEIRTKYPKMKISVRTSHFSGGSSIDVTIQDCGFDPIHPEWDPYEVSIDHKNPLYTEEAESLIKSLEKIGNQYRWDDSDGMVDYFNCNFYFDVAFDWEFERKRLQALGIM